MLEIVGHSTNGNRYKIGLLPGKWSKRLAKKCIYKCIRCNSKNTGLSGQVSLIFFCFFDKWMIEYTWNSSVEFMLLTVMAGVHSTHWNSL